MVDARVPYTDDEAKEAWLWVGRYGPSNSWTATAGTAARMIGRLLEERSRLLKIIESSAGLQTAAGRGLSCDDQDTSGA